MFTGLIDSIARLATCTPHGAGLRVTIQHQLEGEAIAVGESIAVDGCCLTALVPAEGRFDAELSPETLSRTGGRQRWVAGRQLNLERSLRVGDRVGGHWVSGHADGLLRLNQMNRHAGGWIDLRLALETQQRCWVIEKGSIALDGVSLTVARLGEDWIEVALIPETLRATTLSLRQIGDELIVEFDMIGKYAVQAARVAVAR
jgi:riboflavin synthase